MSDYKMKLLDIFPFLNTGGTIVKVLKIGEKKSVILNNDNFHEYSECYLYEGSIVSINNLFHITVIEE